MEIGKDGAEFVCKANEFYCDCNVARAYISCKKFTILLTLIVELAYPLR